MCSLQLDEDVDDVLGARNLAVVVGLQPQCNHYEMLLQFPGNGARKVLDDVGTPEQSVVVSEAFSPQG